MLSTAVRKQREVYRPRTGKSKRAKRWEHLQAYRELSRYWDGFCPIQAGSGRGLQSALNYELSKLTGQGSPLEQDSTAEETAENIIKSETGALD